MTKKITYVPSGVCSKFYEISIKDDIIEDIIIKGGCNGNLQGIAKLIKGRNAKEVINDLQGINCNGKGTSCPDQISKALKSAYGE